VDNKKLKEFNILEYFGEITDEGGGTIDYCILPCTSTKEIVNEFYKFNKQIQQANARIEELETMMINSKIANEVIKACDLNFPIIIELQSKLNLAKTFLEGLLPFMTCLEFDNNLVKTFDFAQIAKNISETISKIKGENDA